MGQHVVEVILEGINNTGQAFREASRSFDDMISQNKALTAAIAAGAILMSKKIVDFGKSAFKSFEDFQYGVRRAAALSGEGEEAFQNLSEAAITYGAATKFMFKDIGEAMVEMTMAGMTVAEVSDSIAAAMDLAQASGDNLADTTGKTVNIMRAFNVEARHLRSVVDVMSNQITKSALTLTELSEAMNYVAPSASTLGVTVGETAAMIGVLADAGIKGSVAGAGMRMAFLRLSEGLGVTEDSGRNAADVLKQLGITVDMVSREGLAGNLELDLFKFLKILNETTSEMEAFEKVSVYAALAGTRASSQMMILTDNLDKLEKQIVSNEIATWKMATAFESAELITSGMNEEQVLMAETINQTSKSVMKAIDEMGGGFEGIQAAWHSGMITQKDMIILLKDNEEAIVNFKNAMNATGDEAKALADTYKDVNIAAQLVAQMNETMQQQLEITEGLFDTVKVEIGSFISQALLPLVMFAQTLMNAWIGTSKEFKKFMTILGAVTAVGLALFGGLLLLKLALVMLGKSLAVAAAFALKLLLPVIAIIAAVALATYGLVKAWQTNFMGIRDILQITWGVIKSIFSGIWSLIKVFVDAFRTAFKPAIDSIKSFTNSFKGIEDSAGIIERFSNTVKRIVEKVTPIIQFFANVLAAYYSFFIGYWMTIIKFWRTVINSFAKAFKPAFDALKDLFNIIVESFGVFKGAGDETKSFGKVVTDVFGLIFKVIEPVAKVLGWFVGTVIGGLVRAIVWVVKTWKRLEELPVVGNLFKGLGVVLLWLINPILGIIRAVQVLAGWFQKLTPYAEKIGKVIGIAFMIAFAPIIAIVWAIKQLINLWKKGFAGEGPFAGIASALINMWNTVKQVWAGIRQIFKGFIDYFKGLFNFFRGLFTGNKDLMKEGFSTMVDGAKNVFLGFGKVIINILKQVFVNIPKYLWELVKLIFKGIVGLGSLLVKALKGLGKLILKGLIYALVGLVYIPIWIVSQVWKGLKALPGLFVKAFNWVVNTVRDGVGKVVDWFRSLPSRILNSILDIGERIVTPFFDAINKIREVFTWENIKESFMNLMNNIVDWFFSLPEKAFDAGKRLVEALGDGIKSAVGFVTDAISDVWDKFTGWLPFSDAKKGPLSNLTERGMAIATTLAEGINKGESSLFSGVEKLASSISDKIKPIISPVVDYVQPKIDSVYQNVTQGVKTFIEPIVTNAHPLIEPIVNNAKPIIEPIVDSVKSFISPIVSDANPLIEPNVKNQFPLIEPILAEKLLGFDLPKVEQINIPKNDNVLSNTTPITESKASPISPYIDNHNSTNSVVNEGNINIDMSGVKIANDMDIRNVAQKLAVMLRNERRLNYDG